LVGAAAEDHDALLAQARPHRRPVDLAGLQLLVHPDLLQARLRVVRAHALLRDARGRADAVDVEDTLAVADAARVPLAPADAARRLRAAHHAARAVDRREERLLVARRGDALEDDGVVAHRAADEALLARPRGRAGL